MIITDTTKMQNKYWTVVAYDRIDRKGNFPIGTITMELYALTEKDALRRAKSMVTRKKYVARNMREIDNSYQKEVVKAMNKLHGGEEE